MSSMLASTNSSSLRTLSLQYVNLEPTDGDDLTTTLVLLKAHASTSLAARSACRWSQTRRRWRLSRLARGRGEVAAPRASSSRWRHSRVCDAAGPVEYVEATGAIDAAAVSICDAITVVFVALTHAAARTAPSGRPSTAAATPRTRARRRTS